MAIGKFKLIFKSYFWYMRNHQQIWPKKESTKKNLVIDLVSEIHLTIMALWERYLHEIKASETHFVSTASHT